jgi:Asp-tRNA(Asn)/Glu-tRNA(Gln) amidotransferase C subunit
MKNLGKDLNKAKKEANKKMIENIRDQFTPERVIGDLNKIEHLVSKMSNFDENIKEDEASKLKSELEEIESYLSNQYKDYMHLNEKDIDLDSLKDDLDTEK